MITKLQPDRTLYIASFTPRSAVGVIHNASATGFRVTGRFNALNDNVILEWNRDNDFEHPSIRYLPNGDFNALTLSYDMSHSGLVDIATELYAYTDFPYLAIYAGDPEQRYLVPLKNYATPVAGDTHDPASASLDLSGTLEEGDTAAVLFFGEAYWQTAASGDTPADLVAAIAEAIHTGSPTMDASAAEATLTLTTRRLGDDANLIRGYTLATGGASWSAATFQCTGGHSPAWHVALPFDSLPAPASNIRKLQWVFSPRLPDSVAFSRTAFQAIFTNWALTGTGATELQRGEPRLRWETDSSAVQLSGNWITQAGQFSQGSFMASASSGNFAELTYNFPAAHDLYAGVWRDTFGGLAQVTVDGNSFGTLDCYSGPYSTYRARVKLADGLAAGPHTVRVTVSGAHSSGSQGWNVNLDFFAALVPANWPATAPEIATDIGVSTDFDTAHSLALSPQRLAWGIDYLGLHGEVNHFVGIGQFAERQRDGGTFPERIYTFSGTPAPNDQVILHFGDSAIGHYVQTGDSLATIAQALAFKINALFTGILAVASGALLTVTVRVPSYTLATSEDVTASGDFAVTAEGALSGGVEGEWIVNPAITPRITAAASAWHQEFAAALAARDIAVTFTYSAELTGAPGVFAQRFPGGTPVITANQSVQTTFRPETTAYWKDIYLETAALMAAAGVTPSLQFGEVQWWYFANNEGMAYYDSHTTAEFEGQFSRPLPVITGNNADPAAFPDEAAFLRGQLQAHVDEIRTHVLASYPAARFEVLWPMDANEPATRRFNFAVNLPDNWTPANFETFKCEAFGYTAFEHDMNKAVAAIRFPIDHQGFPAADSRHIVGLFGFPWPWERVMLHARRAGLGLINVWAYDQFCFFNLDLTQVSEARRIQYVGS